MAENKYKVQITHKNPAQKFLVGSLLLRRGWRSELFILLVVLIACFMFLAFLWFYSGSVLCSVQQLKLISNFISKKRGKRERTNEFIKIGAKNLEFLLFWIFCSVRTRIIFLRTTRVRVTQCTGTTSTHIVIVPRGTNLIQEQAGLLTSWHDFSQSNTIEKEHCFGCPPNSN